MLSPQFVLLTIIDAACSVGLSLHLACAMFKNVKNICIGVPTRLLNMTSENGPDTTASFGHLFQLINIEVG